MTGRILRSILTVAVSVLIASLIVATGFLYSYFGEIQVNQLKDELSLAAAATEKLGADYLSQLDSDRYRITWISADGTVLYDTQVSANEMENHLDREEIKEALESGKGSSLRRSATLSENTLYEAVLLSDGTVLRISVSQATAAALILGMLQPVIIIIFASVILSAAAANRMAKRITEPLNKLDLEHPLENDVYDELSPLLNRIHQQHKQIDMQLRYLNQRKNEFAMVTENMKEGLVLLDNSKRILSINPAAVNLFKASDYSVGEDFLTIDRKHDISLAVNTAFETGHSEIRAERNGREYQFDISRIESDGQTVGAVLLAFDITEQANAERSRREFSANVSHELKTPLQGIIGSSELIENDLVKPEDMPRFIGHIRNEAVRLLTLVEDIIRLSQLDEGNELPTEEVSLYAVCNEVLSSLEETAAKKNVRLSVTGDSGSISGVRRLLYEVIYNLCDNAIKYNVEGGKVSLNIADNQDSVICTVADTGIGIPPEHQTRVFERFYRVDKSHSKKSGGTGLGLSIVKHAVQFHRGDINMSSDIGKGTVITITLPKKQKTDCALNTREFF